MFGADAGGDFFGGAEFHDLETEGEGVRGQRLGCHGDAEFVAGTERAQVVGFAAGNGHDHVGGAEKILQGEAGGGEGLFVGFVADREGPSEEDHAGGVGVGQADGAVVGKRHGDIFDLRFSIFDSIRA